MSLLRLLTSGKSLVGVNDTESRYRLTSKKVLPQFGPVGNPFTNKGKSDPMPAEVGPPGDHNGNGASEDRRGISISGGKAVASLQGAAEDPKVSASTSSHRIAGALRLRVAAVLSRWWARLSRFPRRASGKAAKPAIPRFTKQPVQGELSLDKIKVVRNDLSDADLEVVPARQPAAPASTAPGVRTDKRAGVGQDTWGRVTTRMFGAGKT
jgi:hypothetical protein